MQYNKYIVSNQEKETSSASRSVVRYKEISGDSHKTKKERDHILIVQIDNRSELLAHLFPTVKIGWSFSVKSGSFYL
jgi:hypothetical protein